MITSRPPVINIAIQHDDVDTLKEFVENTVNYNAEVVDGLTIAHLCVLFNAKKSLKLLSSYEIDFNKMSKEGWAPIHYAVKQAPHLIPLLADPKFKINLNQTIPETGDTPVLLAASMDQTSALAKLYEAKADFTLTNKLLNTPIYAAAKAGAVNAFHLLIKYKFNPNAPIANGFLPAHTAAFYGRTNILKEIFLAGGNLEICLPYATPLHYAAEKGHLDAVDFLLKCKVSPTLMDHDKKTPIVYACENGHFSVVARLLESLPISFIKEKYSSFTIHRKIINLLNELEISNKKTGKCAGAAMIFILLELIQKREHYFKLLTQLSLTKKVDLDDEKKEITGIRKAEALAFLTTIELSQSSRQYQHILGRVSTQTEIKSVLALTAPPELEKKGGIHQFPAYINVYYWYEWAACLTAIRAILQKEYQQTSISTTYPLLLSLYNVPQLTDEKELSYEKGHEIAIVYDAIKDKWFSADINYLPSYLPDMTTEEFKLCFPGCSLKLSEDVIKNSSLFSLAISNYYENNYDRPISARIKLFTTKDNPRIAHLNTTFQKLWQSPPTGCPENSISLKRKIDKGAEIPEHIAADSSVSELKQFKRLGIDLNAFDTTGSAIIHYAVMYRNYNLIDYFIKKKYNLHLARSTSETPAILAAINNFADILNTLYEAKVDLDQATPNGITALHAAAMHDAPDAFQFLLQHGAALNKKTIEGWAAIHYAARDNSHKIIDLFIHVPELKKHINVTTDLGRSAIDAAALYNRFAILKKLVDAGATILDKGYTPLHSAARSGHLEIVAYLLKKGLNPLTEDETGNTAIFYAAKGEYWKIFALLLKNIRHQDLNDKDQKKYGDFFKSTKVNSVYSDLFPLHYAAKTNQIEMLDMLLADNADLQETALGDTPLLRSVYSDNDNATKWFLTQGINITREPMIHCMINYAIISENWEIAVLLLMQTPFSRLKIYEKSVCQAAKPLKTQMTKMHLENMGLFKTLSAIADSEASKPTYSHSLDVTQH